MADEDPTPVVRVCRKCSAQSSGTGDYCPHCGTPFVKGRRKPSRRTLLLIIAVVVLLLGAGGGVYAKMRHDENVRAEERAAEAQRSADAEAAAAAAQEESDDQERAARREMVDELEKNITKHAKKAVRTGLLEGPIKYSSCTATGGGSTDDLTALTGTFDCIAVTKEHKDGTATGFGYEGTIDWQTGELTWQLSN